jgi:hypothetical protein
MNIAKHGTLQVANGFSMSHQQACNFCPLHFIKDDQTPNDQVTKTDVYLMLSQQQQNM